MEWPGCHRISLIPCMDTMKQGFEDLNKLDPEPSTSFFSFTNPTQNRSPHPPSTQPIITKRYNTMEQVRSNIQRGTKSKE